jgi:hypothetical protein
MPQFKWQAHLANQPQRGDPEVSCTGGIFTGTGCGAVHHESAVDPVDSGRHKQRPVLRLRQVDSSLECLRAVCDTVPDCAKVQNVEHSVAAGTIYDCSGGSIARRWSVVKLLLL